MAKVILKNVYKKYEPNRGGITAVSDFNLVIEDREFLVLLGPSGCGKTTTLRMIAGLEDITAGEIYIGDRIINEVHPKDRDIAMVFQNYALYPHMTIFDNMAFGLKLRKMPKNEIRHRVHAAAKILEIQHLLDRKPKALSGGQRQRVALGRAIVREPKVFLMDEPLSNLDAKLRAQMRVELTKLHQRLKTTFIYVTHDRAISKNVDRVVTIEDGRTGSEYIKKKSYKEQIMELDRMTGVEESETHEEMIVVDRQGRLKIPEEYLELAKIPNNSKVRIKMEEEKIVIYTEEKDEE
jgi:multiple sugar transport system ATP-binding protein